MTQRTITSPDVPARLLDRAGASGVTAVMIEATDLSPDAETAERWHAVIARIARRVPTAVAVNGDVSHDAIAMFAPAQRIFARETGLVLPGLLRAPTPTGAQDASARGARAGATEAARRTLYRDWMTRALRESPRTHDDGVAAAAQGRALSVRSAIEMGLIDDVGFAHDAVDWARDQAHTPGVDARLAIMQTDD